MRAPDRRGYIAAGALGVLGASLLAARLYSGTQITYVTAAMLSRSLPRSDLRIVQVGGGVKELYYYPSTTIQVRATHECNVNLGSSCI